MPTISLLIVICGVVSKTIPENLATLFEYNRSALEVGELWRLISGHFVSFTWPQLAIDGTVLFCSGIVIEQRLSAWQIVTATLVSIFLISGALYFLVPAIAIYRGLSAISMMYAMIACILIWREDKGIRPFLALMVLAYLIKSALIGHHLAFDVAQLPPNVSVAWQAHLMGATAGVLTMLLLTMSPFTRNEK